MSTKVRVRRKDLRRPDEFVTFASRSIRYAQTHSRPLSWAAAITVALGVAAFAFVSLRSNQEERANTELGQALSAFEAQKYNEARAAFEDVASRFSSTNAAEVARVFVGQVDLASGNTEQALTALQTALVTARQDFLRQGLLLGIGYALEANKDYAQAASRFKDAGALDGPYKASAVLGEARNLELSGDIAGAKAIYSRFVQDFPQVPEHPMVEAHLKSLG